MKVAILALQGAFAEHSNMLDKLGVENFEIRNKEDALKDFDALILPGGESTVMGSLLHKLDIFQILKEKIENGLPTFGTCAGLILLSKKLSNDKTVHFGIIDTVVKRNAYGRQKGSFQTIDTFKGIGKVPMVFIRGPYIEKVGENVEVLSIVDNNIVAIRQNNILACSYHPELTDDSRVHEYFINMIKGEN